MELKYLTDSELVKLCKKELPENSRAFKEIVTRYKNYLYYIALNKLKNHEDAEDATQEAFIRIYHNIVSFREESELKTWITTIINNVCLTIILTQKNKFWKYNVLSNGEIDIENIYTSIYSEESERFFWDKIGSTIKRMIQIYRKVFIFKYFKGLTIISIAQKIHTTVGAAKMKIKRAKDQFVAFFSKE